MARVNKNRNKSQAGSKGGTGGGKTIAKWAKRLDKGGKNSLDRKKEDLANDDRGAGGAKNDRDNPISVDGKGTTNDVGFGTAAINNSPASKEDSHDLLEDDDTKDSSENGNEDNHGKANKTALDPAFSTPDRGSKKHKAVTPSSDKATGVDTEVLGFKRYIVETPKPYTQAEFQPADPEDKCQSERQFQPQDAYLQKKRWELTATTSLEGFRNKLH